MKEKLLHKDKNNKAWLWSIVTLLCFVCFGFAQFNPNVCNINGQVLLNGDTIAVFQNDQVAFGGNCATIQEIFTCNQWILNGVNPSSQPQNYPYTQCQVAAPLSCSLGPTYGQQTVVQHGSLATWYKDDILEPGQTCDTIGPSGNMGVLECNNGNFVPSSWWVANASDYVYPTCEVRETDDCEFNGETVQHGFSVTGYLIPFPTIGQQCTYEIRTCVDGFLSWTYQFDECNETDAVCGSAADTGMEFAQAPQYNLCEEGYPIGSVGVNPTTNRWEWTCGGYWLNLTSCSATGTAINTWVAACTPFVNYVNYMTGAWNNLCTPGNATWFVATQTWWTWNCEYNNTFFTWCTALNTKIPSGIIEYNPDEETKWTVRATLTGLTMTWATIITNSGQNYYDFNENGTFTFMLEIDGKIWFVKAVVDWISKRESIFKEILIWYESNLCDQFAFDLQDAHTSKYKLDIITAKNTCIMRGYRFKKSHLFLPERPISRGEALVTMRKLAERLGDYRYQTNEPTRYKYFKITQSHSLFSYIRWWEDVEAIKYLTHTKKGNNVIINFNAPITQKELKNMLYHVLYIHNYHEPISKRLFEEIDFDDQHTVKRGEHAFILRRILESYEHIPIGNDYRLLYVIYQKIKDEHIDDQIKMLVEINKILTRMPMDMMNSYALTKRRLITDIQAIINNKKPERNAKVEATVDLIKDRLWYMKQPEYIIDLHNIEDVIDDDYYNLER